MITRYFAPLVMATLVNSAVHSDNLIEISDVAHFNKVKMQKKPMVIDIGTVWCGPCQVMKELIEKELAPHYSHILFIKVDGDNRKLTSDISSQYGVRVTGFPTFITVDAHNRMVNKFSGSLSIGLMKRELQKISGAPAGSPAQPTKQPVMKEPTRTGPAAMPKHETPPVQKKKLNGMMPGKSGAIKSDVKLIEQPAQFVKEVIESSKPVVIQFTDHPCKICERIGTVVDKLSTDKDHQNIKFVRINTNNSKLSGILPKQGGLLILPNYHFVGMRQFEAEKDDASLEGAIKRAIMQASSGLPMPQIIGRAHH